nr:hypothetical protein [uncultured Methanoregula sp.]
MTKINSALNGKNVSESKTENSVASPHAVPPRTNGEKATASECQGKKKVCTCPGSRDDTSVAVCLEDQKYLVDLAAETSKRTGRKVTVKETLAEIINNNRERASA